MIMMKYLRVSRNLSLRDVEKLTGISSSHLSRLENKERCYSGTVMNTLADFYGVQPEILTLEHDLVKDEGDIFAEITKRDSKKDLSKKIVFYSHKYNEVLFLLSKIKYEEELDFVKNFLEKLIELQSSKRTRTKITDKNEDEN